MQNAPDEGTSRFDTSQLPTAPQLTTVEQNESPSRLYVATYSQTGGL